MSVVLDVFHWLVVISLCGQMENAFVCNGTHVQTWCMCLLCSCQTLRARWSGPPVISMLKNFYSWMRRALWMPLTLHLWVNSDTVATLVVHLLKLNTLWVQYFSTKVNFHMWNNVIKQWFFDWNVMSYLCSAFSSFRLNALKLTLTPFFFFLFVFPSKKLLFSQAGYFYWPYWSQAFASESRLPSTGLLIKPKVCQCWSLLHRMFFLQTKLKFVAWSAFYFN